MDVFPAIPTHVFLRSRLSDWSYFSADNYATTSSRCFEHRSDLTFFLLPKNVDALLPILAVILMMLLRLVTIQLSKGQSLWLTELDLLPFHVVATYSSFQKSLAARNIGNTAWHKIFVSGLNFSRCQPYSEGFFSGYSGFPPSAKLNPSLFHLDVVLCSKVIHGSCLGAERLVGFTALSVRPR